MNVLLIRSGIVENCISADSVARAQQFYPQHTCVAQPAGVGPGYTTADNGLTFAAAVAVLLALDLSPAQFYARIPAAKRQSIQSVRTTDATLDDFLRMIDRKPVLRVDDPDVQALITYASVTKTYLTAAQAADILRLGA